jgi:acyl-CoA thioesterase I
MSTSSSAEGQLSNGKILILGDSLSAAHNIAIEQSWPVLFEQKLQQKGSNITVINASISGETTQGGHERLPALLKQHSPSHLIIELGGNDGLRGFPFGRTQNYLREMIKLALAQDIKVMMIGVRLPPNLGPVYNQRFQQIYQQLAAELKISYLPRFLEGVAASKPEYMQSDGIHPTAIAQPILADKVVKKFLEMSHD